MLVEYFIDRYARKAGKSIRRVNKRTLDRLQSYPWPGNVRELQNVIERSVIVCDTDEFTVDESWLSTTPAVESPHGLSSTLAGHEKGAFTGAVAQRIGRFELANRGAIFLDEIGEMPLELQPKLLRVLQEREFERLGSSRTIRTDVRMIAATNVDLPRMVAEKRFRADLYYRLNVFPIEVPPLRERPEDIPVLVRHFVREAGHRMNRRALWISPSAMDALVSHSWPGNIRELQNLIERALIGIERPSISNEVRV